MGERGIEAATSPLVLPTSKQTPHPRELWHRVAEDRGKWGAKSSLASVPPIAGISQPYGWHVWLLQRRAASRAPLCPLEKLKRFTQSSIFWRTLTGHHSFSKLLLIECLHQTVLLLSAVLYTYCKDNSLEKNCLSNPRFSVQAADHVPDLPDCYQMMIRKD